MLRRLTIIVTVLLGIAVAMPEFPVLRMIVGVSESQAQEVKRKRKTLFDVLFKKRRKKKKSNRTQVNRRTLRELPGVTTGRKKQVVTTKKRKKRNTVPTKPKVVVVKAENAANILVVGDFMGGGVAKGLERLYADNANLVIVNRSKANSGIVRDDVENWVERIPQLIEEFKPIAVVNLVGMNDRQQMRLETGRVEKMSEAWLAEYNARAEKIVNAAVTANIPMVWVGLPPVRSGKMNADYLAFNEIYRNKVESVGAAFVDVWDGFTNAEGKFVSAGPDINGQIVRLRGSKGINMTRAGLAKLAFFADKALKRIGVINDAEGFKYASLGTINTGNAQPQVPSYDPVGTGKTVVIPLGSPISDGGDVLEGEKDFLTSEGRKESVSFSLVEKGEGYQPRSGRIDAVWGIPQKIEEVKPEAVSGDKSKDEKTSSVTPSSSDTLPKVTNIRPNSGNQPTTVTVETN